MGTTSWIVRTKSRCKTYCDRKTISKLTNSFTMMKFLAMFCLFIALSNEMEAKPIRLISKAQPPANLQDDMVSERQGSSSEEVDAEDEAPAEEEDEDEDEDDEGDGDKDIELKEEEVEEELDEEGEDEDEEDEGDGDKDREEEEEVEEEEEQDDDEAPPE